MHTNTFCKYRKKLLASPLCTYALSCINQCLFLDFSVRTFMLVYFYDALFVGVTVASSKFMNYHLRMEIFDKQAAITRI